MTQKTANAKRDGRHTACNTMLFRNPSVGYCFHLRILERKDTLSNEMK